MIKHDKPSISNKNNSLNKPKLRELVEELEDIHNNLYQLNQQKQHLNTEVQTLLKANDDCDITHTGEKYTVKLHTGYNYKINIAAYLQYKDQLTLNPITQNISPVIEKKGIRELEKYGNDATLMTYSKFITTTRKKLYVKIYNESL